MTEGLRVTDLCATYDGWPLFTGVSVAVAPGQCLVIDDENDVVRTAFLECIAGARRPDSGHVDVGSVGAVWHADGLPEAVYVAETISKRTGRDPGELLDRIGLGHRADHEPWAMSAGERRRIALEIAFAEDRDVLLLDEPERGLDQAGLQWLRARIDDVLAAGRTIVLATYSDRIAESADQSVTLSG